MHGPFSKILEGPGPLAPQDRRPWRDGTGHRSPGQFFGLAWSGRVGSAQGSV